MVYVDDIPQLLLSIEHRDLGLLEDLEELILMPPLHLVDPLHEVGRSGCRLWAAQSANPVKLQSRDHEYGRKNRSKYGAHVSSFRVP
jgi:hypothetical protein